MSLGLLSHFDLGICHYCLDENYPQWKNNWKNCNDLTPRDINGNMFIEEIPDLYYQQVSCCKCYRIFLDGDWK